MIEPVRSLPFGTTRSRVTGQYALITPDTHVWAPLPGWKNAQAVTHISPEMGARFAQYTVVLGGGAASAPVRLEIEHFFYVLSGRIQLTIAGGKRELSEGQFAFIPAGDLYQITTRESAETEVARLALFEKRLHLGPAAPPAHVGDQKSVAAESFQGDPALRLQTLLPVDPCFDMAVNLFTYDPGGHLPQVEVHVMEHGLLMLDGTGIYRLGDEWFPVQRGDVIWMASYCPQWFVAMGKSPAR
ncbi:MAG TPA: (S)-ureidoglycine aminohydrolase, partial [Pirellulales bacterium]|nr:(S)-ureidoglycine aminohydrolase [Pirellulales bacterium]